MEDFNNEKKKEKPNTAEQETKEDKAIGTWLPIGVAIGTVIGSILSFTMENIMFLALGTSGGLILGVFIGSIVAEKMIF